MSDIGGGSAGSVWIYCDEVIGHGEIRFFPYDFKPKMSYLHKL
jgi:hypothetical protein